MSRATIYDNDETREDEVSPIEVIRAHIPSMTDQDEEDMNATCDAGGWDFSDVALRTCRCGERIDGFYEYADHLIAVFGGESHIGG